MKILIKTLLIGAIFQLNWSTASAQQNATIYTLTESNLIEMIDTITAKISLVGGTPPSPQILQQFLSQGMQNRAYPHNPSSCVTPGLEAFEFAGITHMNFNNFVGGTPDMLYVSELQYGGEIKMSHAVYGPEVYQGITFPTTTSTQHIYLVGSFCINCPGSTFIPQCSSNWQFFIIEKNLI